MIFEKNGISYACTTHNMVDLRGEDFIIDSCEHFKEISDDIIIVDYESTDNIKEIVEKYNFNYYKVEPTQTIPFHMSKCWNKAIYESKYEYFIACSLDYIFPKNFTKELLTFASKYDKEKYIISTPCYMEDNPKKQYGFTDLFYKPILEKIRGVDERVNYNYTEEYNEHLYYTFITRKGLGLKLIVSPLRFIHKTHNIHPVCSYTEESQEIISEIEILKKYYNRGECKISQRINDFKQNPIKASSDVANSYW